MFGSRRKGPACCVESRPGSVCYLELQPGCCGTHCLRVHMQASLVCLDDADSLIIRALNTLRRLAVHHTNLLLPHLWVVIDVCSCAVLADLLACSS